MKIKKTNSINNKKTTKTSRTAKSKISNNPKKINENWLKTAWKNAKAFTKKTAKKIKRKASEIWREIRNSTGTSRSKEMFKPGSLIAFHYDAKHKEFDYDKNPLVISLGPSKKYKGLYLGLNVHWVNMDERIALASYFLELKKKRKGKLVYDDVKPFVKKYQKSKKPILRSYIYTRVSKKVYVLDDDMYLSAAAIPSEEIIKGIKRNINSPVGKEK